MHPLLVGVFQVYLVPVGTMKMRFRYCILLHVLLMLYWLMSARSLTGTCLASPFVSRRERPDTTQRRLAQTWPRERLVY